MIKVVEAISDTNIGGAGILLVNRLQNTDKLIFDTTVILPKGSLLEPKIRKTGAKVVTVEGNGDKSFDIESFFSYIAVISKISPQIINAHGSLNARIAARIAKVPVCIYTRHCVYPVSKIYNSRFIRLLFGKATDLISDCIIAVSHSAKENVIKMGADASKIRVIINGAQVLKRLSNQEREKIKRLLGIPPDKTVVTICARLEKCKDHNCFLNAAKLLCDISDGYRFLIVGGGSLEKSLKRKAIELGIKDKVIFTGFVDNVSPFMNITDINVNCSTGTETSSLALSEGMSLGLPAVASDYGGNPYMVRDGENGYIYKAGDCRDLAEKIQKAKDGKNYSRLSQNSKARFEHELNARLMTEKTQRLYLKLLKKRQK